MIEFNCSRTSEDMTPVIRDIEIAKFAQSVLYDYRPELLTYTSYGDDPYYEPALLDPYDFAENYLGSNIEVHDIYTESKGNSNHRLRANTRRRQRILPQQSR